MSVCVCVAEMRIDPTRAGEQRTIHLHKNDKSQAIHLVFGLSFLSTSN